MVLSTCHILKYLIELKYVDSFCLYISLSSYTYNIGQVIVLEQSFVPSFQKLISPFFLELEIT